MPMKRCVLFCIFFLSFVALYAQKAQEVPSPEYSPVGVVPDWVKEKVSTEEFQLWKTMSSIFEVDYSFLRREMPLDKEKFLYEKIIKPMCAAIEKGEYIDQKGELYAVNLLPSIDTGAKWEQEILFRIDEHIRFCKDKALIYQAKNTENTDLECFVWYTYDAVKEECHILKCDIVPTASFSDFNVTLNAEYDKEAKWIRINYAGILSYQDKSKSDQSVALNGDFVLNLK